MIIIKSNQIWTINLIKTKTWLFYFTLFNFSEVASTSNRRNPSSLLTCNPSLAALWAVMSTYLFKYSNKRSKVSQETGSDQKNSFKSEHFKWTRSKPMGFSPGVHHESLSYNFKANVIWHVVSHPHNCRNPHKNSGKFQKTQPISQTFLKTFI